jgi:hypothetical protein
MKKSEFEVRRTFRILEMCQAQAVWEEENRRKALPPPFPGVGAVTSLQPLETLVIFAVLPVTKGVTHPPPTRYKMGSRVGAVGQRIGVNVLERFFNEFMVLPA